MTSPLIRVSSILLIVAACFQAFVNWLAIGAYSQLQTVNGDFYLTIFLIKEIVIGLAFLTLIQQYQHIRHWLGWTGIVLTLGGYIAQIIYVGLYLSRVSVPLNVLEALTRYSLLAISLGLIIWAMDLPTSNKAILVQKAAMGVLSIIPILQYVVLPVFPPLNNSASLTNFLIICVIVFLAQASLGISVWVHHEEPIVLTQQSSPEQSFYITTAPIPPNEL